MNTYKVLDELHVFLYDEIFADFYGTPGAFDKKLLNIHSKNVVYLGSMFECQDRQFLNDQRVIWRMERILRMHRSMDWKKEQVYKLLTEFAEDNSR